MKVYDEKKLKKKYKCTLGDGGWCNGTKVGKAMRCPSYSRCVDGSGVCHISIERGFDKMMCMEPPKPTIRAMNGTCG